MQCSCGFTCGTAEGFTRHLRRFKEDQRGGHRIVALLDTSPSAPASPEGSHPAVEEAAAWVEPGRSLQDGEGSQQARPRRSLDTVDVSVTLMSELSYSHDDLLWQQPYEAPSASTDPDAFRTPRDFGAYPLQSISMEGSPATPSHMAADAAKTFSSSAATADSASAVGSPPRSPGDPHDTHDGEQPPCAPPTTPRPPSPSAAVTPAGFTTGLQRERRATAGAFASAAHLASSALSNLPSFHLRAMALSMVGLDPDDVSTPRVQHIGIDAARDALMWTDPWLSLRVFALGMYSLVCLQYLVHGALVQPSSLLVYASLSYMVLNLVRRRLAQKPEAWGADHAMRTQQSVNELLVKMSMALIPLAGAVAGLAVRTLSGRNPATTIWTGAALSLVLMIGELQLVSQVTLAMLVWAGFFSLPWAYCCCHHALDALAEELVHLGSLYMAMFPRAVHGFGFGSGIIAASLVDAPPAARLATCGAVYGGILFWSYLRLHPLARVTPQVSASSADG